MLQVTDKTVAQKNALCPADSNYDGLGPECCTKNEGLIHRHDEHGRGRTACNSDGVIVYCKGTLQRPVQHANLCAKGNCDEGAVTPHTGALTAESSKCIVDDIEHYAPTANAADCTGLSGRGGGFAGKTFTFLQEIICQGATMQHRIIWKPLCRRTASHVDILGIYIYISFHFQFFVYIL